MAMERNIRVRPLQFRLRALIAITCFTALAVRFGPSVWHRLFPPSSELPSMYYEASGNDLLFYPQGPEFKLSKEAAALKAAREEANAGSSPKHLKR
jgi:hypothetical protein